MIYIFIKYFATLERVTISTNIGNAFGIGESLRNKL